MPPFAGPRLMLCWTRYPVKIRRCPSSIFNREVARELPVHLTQHIAQPRLELDDLGRPVELRLGGAPLVCLYRGLELSSAHRGVLTSGLMIADIPRRDHRSY